MSTLALRTLQANEGPLRDVVVLDLTTALSGPYCTWLLAGLGATVVKVEDPARGDPVRGYAPFVSGAGVSMQRRSDEDMSLQILNRGRGKHAITLNLKSPEAAAIWRRLVPECDVVVENFSSGTAARLGIGYEATRALNPRIVYCSISGFGAGVDPGRKAMDSIIQALSGVMLTSGEQGADPVRVGIPLADTIVSLFALAGIQAALLRRGQTGRGEHVDVSMLGTLTSMVAMEDWQAMASLGYPTRTGNTLARLSPFGTYRCRDGHVSLVAGGREQVARQVFRVIGRPELADDPRYATVAARAQRDPEITGLIEAWTSTRPVRDVLRVFEQHDIPAAPVRSPEEAVGDPLAQARGEVMPVEHPSLGRVERLHTSGQPIRFAATPTAYGKLAPTLGQDNDLVYGQLLAFSAAELERWRADGTI